MSAQKLSKSQIEAKEYVEKHSLDKILNEMLNSLIYNKCEHPTVFMINYLASKLPYNDLNKAGIHISHLTPKDPEEAKIIHSPDSVQKIDSQTLAIEKNDPTEEFREESPKEKSSSDSEPEKPAIDKIESKSSSKSSKSSSSSSSSSEKEEQEEENNKED